MSKNTIKILFDCKKNSHKLVWICYYVFDGVNEIGFTALKENGDMELDFIMQQTGILTNKKSVDLFPDDSMYNVEYYNLGDEKCYSQHDFIKEFIQNRVKVS